MGEYSIKDKVAIVGLGETKSTSAVRAGQRIPARLRGDSQGGRKPESRSPTSTASPPTATTAMTRHASRPRSDFRIMRGQAWYGAAAGVAVRRRGAGGGCGGRRLCKIRGGVPRARTGQAALVETHLRLSSCVALRAVRSARVALRACSCTEHRVTQDALAAVVLADYHHAQLSGRPSTRDCIARGSTDGHTSRRAG